MTSARPCRTCARPIKWVGGFRQPVDAEGAYFIKVTHGAVWRVAYRVHMCKPVTETPPDMQQFPRHAKCIQCAKYPAGCRGEPAGPDCTEQVEMRGCFQEKI